MLFRSLEYAYNEGEGCVVSHAVHQSMFFGSSGRKDSASERKAKENSAGFAFALPNAAYLMQR